ncbi:carbamoyltransferase HypF [Thiobacter aerophilum]|uniref:Carbamoyltransferase HypF n=1 Tax=Thiobacter aerophilum TaxID=3121275 RepID=A0ABV0EHJ6_9BURK
MTVAISTPSVIAARRLFLGGRVQGVGFRPFVFRLATRLGLAGTVQNLNGQVCIEVQGPPQALDVFTAALLTEAPPLAQPELLASEPTAPRALAGFAILASGVAAPDVHLPPDQFCCDDCLRELTDPSDRRYRYPFINCTQCGPRYTLIAGLPYDRARTAMAAFALCPACHAEYENPLDRRFHAEPLACPSCGPQLRFVQGSRVVAGNEAALAACVALLRAGGIVAVKGVGGYHLLVAAQDEAAVGRLRQRKRRPTKPFAVMFPWQSDLTILRRHLRLSSEEEAVLRAPERPILLLARAADCGLADAVAPWLGHVGAFLPYSPLHHLLLGDYGAPVVATSANLSGEPVLTDGKAVAQRLARVADAFLHHDRPILRPADDTVRRFIAGRARPLRLGRGMAPVERVLPTSVVTPTLAVGGHLKNTIALAWDRRVVISPHIGDLDAPRSRDVFGQTIEDLQRLYGVRATRVVCDAHPDYGSSRWARASGLKCVPVLHHHAHASALAGEWPAVGHWLVFTWDGVGLGEDGTLWGGEAFLGRPGHWRRVASLRPFRLPGGEAAAREPWRAAAALCWSQGLNWSPPGVDVAFCRGAWARGINAPETSAAGRLFDAAAALLGLVQHTSYEGEGPMRLEAFAQGEGAPVALPLKRDAAGVWRADWAPLLAHLLDARVPPARRAADFHASLARLIVEQTRTIACEAAFEAVGLAGGVFQNRLLAEHAAALLDAAGWPVRLCEALPCNDGGLAFGQIIHVAANDHA